ncbi:MAG: 50S ribosomal protein L3 [Chloroflexi bacterium]|nr:50S ribosomal protein L3 [Chloroflexota bacterium]
MVKSILGSKVGMTQVFDSQGRIVSVTVVQAGPCVVTQVKTVENDGYHAVQIGFGDIHAHRLTRPERGHLGLLAPRKAKDSDKPGAEKSGAETNTAETSTGRAALRPCRHLREVRLSGPAEVSLGDEIRVDNFAEGDLIAVTGVSKGKGFAGAIKRHHFHGANMTHGAMEVHRKPASSGATDAARTFKGMKKPGHLGAARVTTRGLKVVKVDGERNLILVGGTVPGANGSLVFINEQKGAK